MGGAFKLARHSLGVTSFGMQVLDMAVRVGPGAKRQLLPGDHGLRLIILGGVPGKVYEAPIFTAPKPRPPADEA